MKHKLFVLVTLLLSVALITGSHLPNKAENRGLPANVELISPRMAKFSNIANPLEYILVYSDKEEYRCLDNCAITVHVENHWLNNKAQVPIDVDVQLSNEMKKNKRFNNSVFSLQQNNTQNYTFNIEVPTGINEKKFNITVKFAGFDFLLDPDITSGCSTNPADDILNCTGALTGNNIYREDKSIWIHEATIDTLNGNRAYLNITTNYSYINMSNVYVTANSVSAATEDNPAFVNITAKDDIILRNITISILGDLNNAAGDEGGYAKLFINSSIGKVELRNGTYIIGALGSTDMQGSGAGQGGNAEVKIYYYSTVLLSQNNFRLKAGRATGAAEARGGDANFTVIPQTNTTINTFINISSNLTSGIYVEGGNAADLSNIAGLASVNISGNRIFIRNTTIRISGGVGALGAHGRSNSSLVFDSSSEIQLINVSINTTSLNDVVNSTIAHSYHRLYWRNTTVNRFAFTNSFFSEQAYFFCNAGTFSQWNLTLFPTQWDFGNCTATKKYLTESEYFDTIVPNVGITQPPKRNDSIFYWAANFSETSFNRTFYVNISDENIGVVFFNFSNATSTPFFAQATNSSGTWFLSYNVSSLSEGYHSLIIIANDTNNNLNNSETINFTVDFNVSRVTITLPTAQINYSIDSFNQTFSTTIQEMLVQTVLFSFTNETPNFNATPENTSGTWSLSYNVSSLSESHHIMTTLVNDSVGHFNRTEFIRFTVDFTEPRIIRIVPINYSNFSETSFNQTLSSYLRELTPQTIMFYFDNSTSIPSFNVTSDTNSSGNWTISYNMSSLAEGKHRITILANDTFGRFNRTEFIEYHVDLNMPNLTIVDPTGTLATSTTNITIRYEEAFPTTCIYWVTRATGAVEVAATAFNCGNSTQVSGLADASYVAWVNVSDCCHTNMTNSTFTVNTAGGGGGGGGGGGATTIIAGGVKKDFDFISILRKDFDDFISFKGKTEERTLIIKNKGDKINKFTLSCSGDVCPWVKFSENDFVVEPAEDKEVKYVVKVPIEVLPQSYAFKIIGNADNNIKSMEITVRVSKIFGFLLKERVYQLFPDTEPIIIPYWVIIAFWFIIPLILSVIFLTMFIKAKEKRALIPLLSLAFAVGLTMMSVFILI